MPKTILIIDDEEAFRCLLQDVLEGSGCQVLLAQDGSHAIDVLCEHANAVDLILLDGTPYESRRETFLKLQALRPGIPVAVMSGKAWEDLRPQFEGLPVAGYLPKPAPLGQLLELVERLAHRPVPLARG